MRETRNALKNTPPSKKPGKAPAGNKGTPKSSTAEKKEGSPKIEATTAVAFDVEVVLPAESSAHSDIKPEAVSTNPGGAGALDGSIDEKAVDEVAPKSKLAATKKKAATHKKKADESSEKEEYAGLKPSKENAEEPIESAPGGILKQDFKASEVVEKDGTEQVKLQVAEHTEIEMEKVEEDAEMQEGGEDPHEQDDQSEGVENDDAENGEEEGGGDEGVGYDFMEQRPVTERQKRKSLEVFVGGLDKEATEDEVKKAFEVVGEVVEVRLMTHSHTGKNRGYAFVRYATVDQAIRAATELDKTKVRDRECAVVPSDDNDTLFVGNLCRTWKSEQVLEKLKKYGIEGIDDMTLVEDPDNKELNRGHALLEFATHNDAVKAFKRLSKPDAIFGSDRSARVAWAEDSSEPDETVMARVKSVFVDGMPLEWDDVKLKEHFGKYGDIDRIVLAKNIPRSKRMDFAFVNFATRDAALAAIEALSEIELMDGDNKVKLKVELAKPAPRKKGMKGHRGSYPIGAGPAKQKKGKGKGGRAELRRGKGGRAELRRGKGNLVMSRGVLRIRKGVKRQAVDERPLREERSRDRHPRGPKFPRAGAAVPPSRRGARGGNLRGRGGSLSRRGGSGAHSDEEYVPLGARLSPGSARTGFSGHPPREDAYPRRVERGRAYERKASGPGIKRSYSAVGEEAAYYESGQRGYPRARMEYAEPGLGGGSLYPDPIRAAPLAHASLGGRGVLPATRASIGSTGSSSLYSSGTHGYASVLPQAGDYNGYLSGAADPRGGSYPSSYYGSGTGSGYGLPGGSGPYY